MRVLSPGERKPLTLETSVRGAEKILAGLYISTRQFTLKYIYCQAGSRFHTAFSQFNLYYLTVKM
jgi:hypothetical protein